MIEFKTVKTIKHPILEERLYEELGVSDEVLKCKKELIKGIETVIASSNLSVNLQEQNLSGTLNFDNKHQVKTKVTIKYHKNMDDYKKSWIDVSKDAWYEPWNNTFYLIVDTVNKKYYKTYVESLIQHELTHAYQTLLCKDNGYNTIPSKSYEASTTYRQDNNTILSAASWTVYFSNYGEMSANANELYPYFMKYLHKGDDNYEKALTQSPLYSAVLKVRKLNNVISEKGRGVLTDAAEKLNVSVSNLVSICRDFPKHAMAYIS
ncbi:MAG: hypothetical protein J6X18_14975, partial [Bacteroidales bacterium]|nr:hypothetical protein [Bacteroidales bacterium]